MLHTTCLLLKDLSSSSCYRPISPSSPRSSSWSQILLPCTIAVSSVVRNVGWEISAHSFVQLKRSSVFEIPSLSGRHNNEGSHCYPPLSWSPASRVRILLSYVPHTTQKGTEKCRWWTRRPDSTVASTMPEFNRDTVYGHCRMDHRHCDSI